MIPAEIGGKLPPAYFVVKCSYSSARTVRSLAIVGGCRRPRRRSPHVPRRYKPTPPACCPIGPGPSWEEPAYAQRRRHPLKHQNTHLGSWARLARRDAR